MAVRTISILGATGSIGDSTLDLIRARKDDYDIRVLTAGGNWQKLAALAQEFKPAYVALADMGQSRELKESLPEKTQLLDINEAAQVEADWTMAAIVGTAGLIPAMTAIRRGAVVAFASKECLVAAGRLMMDAAAQSGATLLPVDSEHNAIYQVFDGRQRASLKRLILTASGGPFRTASRKEMERATPKQAVAHPTWSMGAKISVDSATLMNKALEVIEAHYLFAVPSDQIDVIIHPQSLIHSMVEYTDGSILAQMGPPDMRTPIAYCLGWPERIPTSGQMLDFSTVSRMTFEQPDTDKFQSLAMVRDVLAEGQAAGIIFNAANEEAVAAFLAERIGFTHIYDVLHSALDKVPRTAIATLEDVTALDAQTRRDVRRFLNDDGKKTVHA